MAQHGYLREYDEGWERGDDERDRERERDWRDEDRRRDERERDRMGSERTYEWRDEDRDSGPRGNFMLGRHERGEPHGRDDRSSRSAGDRTRSSLSDDERQYGGTYQDQRSSGGRASSSGYAREHGYGGFQGNYGRSGRDKGGFGGRGDWERSPRNFSSHQDDHYRSWRDRQMSALDRDYEDYCREREQQFHHDFDNWRQSREKQRSQGQGQQPSQGSSAPETQSSKQAGHGTSEEVMELSNPTRSSTEPQTGPSPIAEATLGTNNSENSGVGRGRR